MGLHDEYGAGQTSRRASQSGAHLEVKIHRTHIAEAVAKAQQVSEEAVLAVGAGVRQIVDETEQYVTVLAERLVDIGDEEREGSLAYAIDKQSHTIESFLTTSQKLVREQNEQAARGREHSERITQAGKLLSSTTSAAKLLALNAQIEAARLGEQGAAMTIIAKELMNLSVAVEQSNRVISALSVELSEMLPGLASRAEELFEHTEQFAEEIQYDAVEVRRSSEKTRETVIDTLNEGDDKLSRIIEGAYEVLSQLQFQDPMIQDLQALDVEMYKLESTIATMTESTMAVQEPAFLVRESDQDGAYDDADVEHGLEALDDGELLLF